MKKIAVYIGGSSSELERHDSVAFNLSKVEGIRITSNWAKHVKNNGGGNPRGMKKSDQFVYAYSDLYEVSQADWLLLLMPAPGIVSAGAFLEMGFALARGINVCVSGIGQDASIFTSMAQMNFDRDEDALDFFFKLVC